MTLMVIGRMVFKDFRHIFTSNLRVIDKVCRYGGDEFVAMLPNTDIAQAKITAENCV